MIKIRKYREENKEKVENMIKKVLFELFGKHLIKKWEDFKKYRVFYVAEDNGKIIGTAALKNMSNGTVKLKRMYILQEYRNRGLGQKLIDKIFDYCKNNNFKRIILSTEQRLKASHNFYAKNGFKDIKNVDWKRDFADLKNERVNISKIKFMEKKLI